MEDKVVVKKMKEFVRFCIVGVIATAIHYGLYMLLIYIIHIPAEWWTNLAYTIGYVVSWGCNLWLTAHFTFKESVSMQRGIGFAVSHGVNYLLHILFLNVFLWLGVSDKWAPIPVYCLVVPINFILVRTVFKKLK
jgi:putative flippase GtrA